LQRYDLAFDTEVAKREWLEAIANAITANAKGAPVGPVRSIKTALVFNSNVESLPIKYKGEFRLGKVSTLSLALSLAPLFACSRD